MLGARANINMQDQIQATLLHLASLPRSGKTVQHVLALPVHIAEEGAILQHRVKENDAPGQSWHKLPGHVHCFQLLLGWAHHRQFSALPSTWQIWLLQDHVTSAM